jgi:hypothetical protein
MSHHRAPRASRLRNIGRASAVLAGGVLALSGIAAGTASADEGHEGSGYGEADKGASGANGFTPTTPVDGFTYHWMKYHYGEENFAGNEANRILTDPGRYVDIHLDMVKMMLGEDAPEDGMDSGGGGY